MDPNIYCENYALFRLNTLNNINNGKKSIHLKEYLIGFAENVSYIRNNSIDLCVCTDVLSYVQDLDQTLSEIHRILKPVIFFTLMCFNQWKASYVYLINIFN